MLIAFADNLTLVAIGTGVATTVYTDPVPLGNNDRLTGMLNVHSLVKTAGTATLTYTAQVSNDGGQNYVDSTTVTDSTTAVGVLQKVGTINGALVRFKYGFIITGGAAGDVASVCFDLHVNLDHV
jgi:hypothetical protein